MAKASSYRLIGTVLSNRSAVSGAVSWPWQLFLLVSSTVQRCHMHSSEIAVPDLTACSFEQVDYIIALCG